MKTVIRDLTPPVLWSALRKLKDSGRPAPPEASDIFGGAGALFKEAVRDAHAYAEYGVGASTRWVDEHTDARIISVDTSLEWIETVRPQLTRDRHELLHVDVGPLGDWGRPSSFRMRHNFVRYAERVWEDDASHDVVLVDGRFRIACFLTAFMRAKPGCIIVFDDYVRRPIYNVVEEVVPPDAINARQALFVVPEERDIGAITEMRDAFLMVRE